ncbi:MAG: glutamate-1-semialdehyde 2,1-aminomutase [Dehalococcoidia bacterium]|nr:glutamate-1-semialdehyde 2,1-aminomutase [Dehalococcoidia bacterium]
MKTQRSAELFEEARRLIPGGVDSPVRAFGSVGGNPFFVKRGAGSHLFDEDGNEFVDYVCSWGPLILGHAHPRVVEAVQQAAENGLTFGAPCELETTLAKMVTAAMPSVEMVRFVNSGTEAVMSALRVARAFTGRNKVVKFAGCYHGHSDALLVKAGSGLATLGLPSSPGVPASWTNDTLVARYNDLESVERLFAVHGKDIAAVILEPVAANMGVVWPRPGFLADLRKLTKENGALLVFDEVITGFRASYGGAQALLGVTPDLTTLGKIVGGGLPVGAYGGRREIMELVAPSGAVYQAGTLSGNPLAMTAGIETLKLLGEGNPYSRLQRRSDELTVGLSHLIGRAGVPAFVSGLGSLFTVFFSREDVYDYDSALRSETHRYRKFFWSMLEAGVYMPPSQFEACFVSLAHSAEDVALTLEAAEKALSSL